MNNQDLISVIVPIFNVEEFINRCIDSIINQTYKNLEIILVNDGSTDNCPSICEEYKKIDKRIKIIHKENGGLGDARNAGISCITGDYLMFVDSDDWLELNAIEFLFYNLRQTGSDICIGCIQEHDNSKVYNVKEFKTSYIIKDKIEIFQNYFKRRLELQVYPSACSKLFKSKVFCQQRFTKGINNEDIDIMYKILYSANHITYCEQVIYHYDKSRTNSLTDEFRQYNYKDVSEYCNILKETCLFFYERNEQEIFKIAVEFYILELMNLYKAIYLSNSLDNKFKLDKIMNQLVYFNKMQYLIKLNIKQKIKFYLLVYCSWSYRMFLRFKCK